MVDQLTQHDPRRIGPFEVLGRLGAGGMGLVYLARSASGRRVAIKTVRTELAEDQLFRVTFRAEPDEVLAFEHLGEPYFRASWGRNVVGMLLDDRTDWDELAELLTDSYCIQAPVALAARVQRPGD